MDENLKVTYKGVGPCCRYRSYYDCTEDVVLGLNKMLTNQTYKVYNKEPSTMDEGQETAAAIDTTATHTTGTTAGIYKGTNNPTAVTATTPIDNNDVRSADATEPANKSVVVAFQSTTCFESSACSKTCNDGGIQFHLRLSSAKTVETQSCPKDKAAVLPPCQEQCVEEFGNQFDVTVVASNLNYPRDLAFHPTPGIHLGL